MNINQIDPLSLNMKRQSRVKAVGPSAQREEDDANTKTIKIKRP